MFPVDSWAVVSRVRFQVAGREAVDSLVMRKEEAVEKYEDALARGQQAVLSQHHDIVEDILHFSIGGMKPGERVTITVTMLKLLEIENEYFLFRLPTSYFARFNPAAPPYPGPPHNVGGSLLA